MTEAMNEDSRIGDGVEGTTDSDIEIKRLMEELDSSIEEFILSTSRIKY